MAKRIAILGREPARIAYGYSKAEQLPRFRRNIITLQPQYRPGLASVAGHPAAWMKSQKPKQERVRPMERAVAPSRQPDRHGVSAEAGKAAEPRELDLERLIWDPEYREAMRAVIKRGT